MSSNTNSSNNIVASLLSLWPFGKSSNSTASTTSTVSTDSTDSTDSTASTVPNTPDSNVSTGGKNKNHTKVVPKKTPKNKENPINLENQKNNR